MTQIFTGTGTGLHGSSLGQLGSYGPKGTASLGQGGSSVYVNAANGNLVLKQSDGFLANSGVSFDLFQSYNSRNARSWQFNTDTRLAFEGKANTMGSMVTRTDEDGHQSRFIYDARQHAYLADDGSTAKLTFDGSNWNYREGSSQTTCHYNTDGQLTRISDQDGHILRFSYQNGQLTRITDNSDKQTITWSFSQGRLRDVTVQSEGQTVHHLHYDYDAQNRLNRVSRDLGDGKTYWIAYDYAGESNLISDIRQSDGTTLHMDYDAEDRIKWLIDGEGRTTSYDYLDGKTVITNGLGESWAYYYDADARLTGIDGPEQYHIRYHYEGQHLDSITQGNQRWLFNYNDAGDCIRMQSPAGEVTERIYDSEHRLLSETRYQTFDGNHHPTMPQTAHFIYDEQGHLRFEITPDGVVTEHRYDINGYRINSRCYMQGRYANQTTTLDTLINWSQLQTQHAISLTDYQYDWRGSLCEEIHYTQINEQGDGIATADTMRTYSRYDAAGQLIEKSSLTDSGLSTTHYFYDDLGRLIKTIDNQQHTQTIDYDDTHQRILKTDANSLQTLSIHDKSGLLLSTQRLDITHDYGTTTYRYDAAGRLIAETDVTGNTRHLFYDAQGRLQANVSVKGQVTEYLYDDEGHCIQTHHYQQLVNVTNPSSFDAIRPSTTNQDRISQVVYNEYSQIAYQIDAEGAVIGFQYDAQGHITTKTAYARRLTHDQPNVQRTCVNIALISSAEDRTITYYHDASGRLQGEINGEDSATSYRYDAQGHLIECCHYFNKVLSPRTAVWFHDVPLANEYNDIRTYSLYNTAGLKIADIDGEGYLTEYRYDSSALLTETIGYNTELEYLITINETTILDTIRPRAHANDHHTTYRYNDLNQRIEEKTSTGLVITYAYNEAGLVVNETRIDQKTLDARSQQYRHDAMGRVIQRLDAQGAALLAQNNALSQDDIETIWQQHSVHFDYDIAGNLISKTNALNETTRYVYNHAGLLTYTISPVGAITETRYNTFQQIETTIHYSAYYPDNTQASLADIKQYMSLVANPNLDEIIHYEYNTLGLLVRQQTGSGSTQVTTYNAFGELSQLAQRTSARPDILTDYQYDRRGLLRYRTNDTGGINKTSETGYDAFGRVEKQWNGQHGAMSYYLNKRGEQETIIDETRGMESIHYDAFGRIVRVSGKNNLQYTYDDQHNTLTLKREGTKSTIITQFNAFGDKLSITDGNHQTTTYQYDTLGKLIHVDAPEHTTADYTYDAAGRLLFQHDADGHIVRFTYDAEGHVLTKTRDPDGLNITTSYTYDAIGRQLQVIDAGRCTQFSYDNQGNLIQTCQDPNGLNLITTLRYNDLNQLIRETRTNPQGIDQVTAYTRDALGRCLIRTIDPDGLHLSTTYTYDNNDNVISQTDANQNTTHYVYDASNRVRYRIDACGIVTEHGYNSQGYEIRTTTYAHRIAFASSYDEAILISMIQPDQQADHHQFFIFDMQGLLFLSYDGAGYTTVYTYDANENLIVKKRYDEPYSLSELIKGRGGFPTDSQSRTTRFVYDGLNHQRFQIDSEDQVTEFRHDAAGHLLEKIRYTNPISPFSNDDPLEIIQTHIKPDPVHDEHTHYAYDKVGRLTLQASAAGVITAYEYDAVGNQTASHQYATRLTASQLNNANWPELIQESPDDRVTRAVFDAAGRAIYRISPTGHVVERGYDAVGNVISESNGTHSTQFNYDAAGRLLTQIDAAQHTTRYTYDRANNVASKTDANNAQWQYRYNAANQLIETLSPITTFSTYTNGTWHEETRSIITQNEYDSFGNIIRKIHDAGGINQTIQYTYDANNRKLQTIYPDMAINNAAQHASNDRGEFMQTLTETSVYNAYGELIEYRDRAGHSRHYAYDRTGQQIYAVNAEGGVTRYYYDAFGNVSTKITYATPMHTNDYSVDAICLATTISKQDRHEYYSYDSDHRLIESHQDPVVMYNSHTGEYAHTLSPTTRITYNAFGDIIQQAVQLTDSDWAITSHTYDNDGLKTTTLDAEQYLTTYRYNAFGLLDTETHYATRGAQPSSSSKDRTVTFLYNVQGQLIQKTLKNVTVSHLTGNGTQFDTITCDLTSHYGYDAMGKMVSTTDTAGHTAYSYYNTQGQLIAKVGMKTESGRAATTYRYDALGQLVENHQWANGAQDADSIQFTLNNASNRDIVSHDVYDATGHVTQKMDGTGHTIQYSYDANGNVARRWQLLNETTLISDKRYTYDQENHLIQTATLNATGVRTTDDAQYNTFGEVIKKGLDGIFSTQLDYDKIGRVWRSNTQGYFQIYVYDLSDHVTQIVTSTNMFRPQYYERGDDLSNKKYDNHINFDQDVAFFDLQRQDNLYDALGHLVGQTRDARINILEKNNKDILPRIRQTQTVDRWGNILLHTNASGHTTRYDYNALNALTEQILPEVTTVDEHGVARILAPVNHYAIDSLGHTIAMTDANGHTIAHVYDAEGRITEDIDARGNHRDKTYNLLGQLTTQTNERAGITSYTYDGENRLLSVTTSQTAQHYEYNGAGQIIRQTDAAGNVQTMTYDELGHLIQKTAQNGTTTYQYDHAGHKTTEQDANGNTSTWRYDEHGRLIEHTDLGGHRTDYTYNHNGLLLSEKSTSGKSIVNHYFSDGKLAEFVDNNRVDVVNFRYDVEGNIASKETSRLGNWIKETDHYDYDALGRITHVARLRQNDNNKNLPPPDLTMLSIDYDYDAVGNIRDTRVSANYTGYHSTSHTDYFRYDENNRMTINKGQLINGQIGITNTQGTALAYDETGNIADAQTIEHGNSQHYTYRYNTDNLLEITRKNDHDFQTKRYTAGILSEETLFNDYGQATQHNTLAYENGRLTSQTTQDANQNVASRTHYHYDAVGNIKTLTTQGAGYTQTHQYDYELWDGYLQKTDNLTLNVEQHATSYGKSTHTYDLNGLLQDLDNSQSPDGTTHYYASNLDGIHSRKDNNGETNYITVGDKTIGDVRLDNNKNQTLNVYSTTVLPNTQQDNLGAYTLNAGDTLDSIALQIYGDSSLWYLIADANGITNRSDRAGEKGSQLHAGMRLNLPPVTKGQHNTHATHTILSSTDWTGDTTAIASPLLALTPAPPAHKHHHHNNLWKTIAKIAVVVTAAVAMVLSAGALAVLAGATVTGLGSLITTGLSVLSGTAGLNLIPTLGISFAAGFTSSIAGQTAANLLHQQNGMDLKSALLTGLGTAATAGIGHLLSTSKAYATIRAAMQNSSPPVFNVVSATEMMERDAISQSLNLALTRHQHFDWMELGVSAATAGIMGSTAVQGVNNTIEEKLGRLGNFATSELQALATGAATGNFDAAQILQDNLGNAVSSSLLQPTKPAASEKESPTAPEDIVERHQRESKIRQRLEQMEGQYMNDFGADLGVFGDAAHENRAQLSVEHGVLSSTNNKIHSINGFNSKTNRVQLATLIMSEASIGNYAEQVAVGSTVINRMYRNKTTKVGDVWNAYAHHQAPSQKILNLATNLLSGNITDNTGGATHYYSPRSMPKKGAPTEGFDIGGGLERIIGRTIENYRPSFATSFKYVKVPDVREDYYKFYFAPGAGKVR